MGKLMYVTKASSPIRLLYSVRGPFKLTGARILNLLGWAIGITTATLGLRNQTIPSSVLTVILVILCVGQVIGLFRLGSRANASRTAFMFLKSIRKTVTSLHRGYSNKTTKPTSLMEVGNKLCSYTIASRLTRWKLSHRILGSPSP